MYAIEYKTDSCGICKAVEENLKSSGIKFTILDKSCFHTKLYKTPFTEFYTDEGTLVDHRIGLVSIQDIQHLISIYDKKGFDRGVEEIS